jgi:pimeloyl-ACP methyl ester carboxylesterase
VAGYVDLGGVRTWYEERGEGDPVALLHGGLTDSRDFNGNLGDLSARFRLYLPERRGHGHTPDVEGPWSLEVAAGDTIAFVERIVGGPVRLVRYSAGAIVALHVAVQRPDLVERPVLISGAFSPECRASDIPNASHLLLHEPAGDLTRVVGDFLAGELVSPMMPLRRTAPA